jgi:hypothetical protein
MLDDFMVRAALAGIGVAFAAHLWGALWCGGVWPISGMPRRMPRSLVLPCR